jgi:hypothetical protein
MGNEKVNKYVIMVKFNGLEFFKKNSAFQLEFGQNS